MLNREINWYSLTTTLEWVLSQWSRANLHTAMPGIVESYDGATRRARIRPALRLVMTGTEIGEDGEELERALAVNIPVLWPASSGYILMMPLVAGDRGMMVFSERGMTEFLRTGELATPDKSRFFDEADAAFLPADFGHPAATPASTTGACLQTHDGTTAIIIEDGSITLKTTGAVAIDSATLTHNGTDVGDSHQHSGVASGPANTGAPV